MLTELDRQAELVKNKKAEYLATAARYDADRARWRELSAAGRTTAPESANGTGTAPGAPAAASKSSPPAVPPRK